MSSAATAEVKRALLDLVGVTVLGATEPAGMIARSYARSQGSAGPSAVIGGEERLSPSLAALVNGTAGHALDYDDIGLGAGHISVAIVPAALAVADQLHSSGAEFIDAMVLGYEVAHRLTEMYEDKVSGPYEFGYHKPSVYSSFGAAAAASRLLGLDTLQIQHAFGITASQSGGLRVNFGTMTKPFHAGIASRTGVEAALLVQQGFTASDVALEGLYGWYDAICRKDGNLAGILDSIGKSFAVEEGMIFKGFPCCGANHYAIDGVLQLMTENHLSFEDVDEIEVTIQSRNLEEVLVYPWPSSGLEGKFCLAYNVAAAAVDGAVTVGTFTDEHVATLMPAREQIKVNAKRDMPRDGAFIKVRTIRGQEIEKSHFVLRGSLADPFSPDELAAKFTANTAGILTKEASTEIAARIDDLEHQNDIRLLTEFVLRPAADGSTDQ
jgi:2-methylcitrate dehydratase PrpD